MIEQQPSYAKPKFPKPKITSAFKKRLVADWNEQLPFLHIEKKLSLGRRIGPVLISIGFDIKSGSEEYYPGFSVHNFCRDIDYLIASLDTPLRTNKTNAIDMITVREHEKGIYIEAAERMRRQSPLPLDEPISLKMIVLAYESYFKRMGFSSIKALEDPILLSSWCGKDILAKELLEDCYKTLFNLEEYIKVSIGGIETWYKSMKEKISNPQRLREIAEEQAKFHKVDHIPMEELIVD